MSDERLAAVSPLLDLGLHVVPLADRSKEPRPGVHWKRNATDDPAVLEVMLAMHPDANLGVVTARSPRHGVLDVDPRNGGAVDQLGELPPTLTVETGRGDGGLHLYFELPDAMDFDAPPGVDDKTNGYVLAPGAVHPDTGQRYRIVDGSPPALAPNHLLVSTSARRGPAPSRGAASRRERPTRPDVSGQLLRLALDPRRAQGGVDRSERDFEVAKWCVEHGVGFETFRDFLLWLPQSKALERGEAYVLLQWESAKATVIPRQDRHGVILAWLRQLYVPAIPPKQRRVLRAVASVGFQHCTLRPRVSHGTLMIRSAINSNQTIQSALTTGRDLGLLRMDQRQRGVYLLLPEACVSNAPVSGQVIPEGIKGIDPQLITTSEPIDLTLTPTEAEVLRLIRHGCEAEATAIPDALGVSRSSVYNAFTKLADVGLIDHVNSALRLGPRESREVAVELGADTKMKKLIDYVERRRQALW